MAAHPSGFLSAKETFNATTAPFTFNPSTLLCPAALAPARKQLASRRGNRNPEIGLQKLSFRLGSLF